MTKEVDAATIDNLIAEEDYKSDKYRSRPRVMVVVFTTPYDDNTVQAKQTNRDYDHIRSAFKQEPFWLPNADIKNVEVTSKEVFAKKFDEIIECKYGATWYDNFVFVFLANFQTQAGHGALKFGDDVLKYEDIISPLFLCPDKTVRDTDRFVGKPKVFLFQDESGKSGGSKIFKLPKYARNTVLLASSLPSTSDDSPSPLIKEFVAKLSHSCQHGQPFGPAIEAAVKELSDKYQKIGVIMDQ